MSDRLIVSERSWHYKLFLLPFKIVGTPAKPPKTLCGYFWGTLYGVWMTPWLFLFKYLMLTPLKKIHDLGEVQLAVVLAAFCSAAVTSFLWLDWVRTLEIAGGIVGGLAFLLGVFVVSIWLKERWDDRHEPKVIVEKDPNLIWEFLKAKKRRVCPLIEYKP